MFGFISGFWSSKYRHPDLENVSANLDRKEPVAEEKPAASVANQTTKPKVRCTGYAGYALIETNPLC